MTDLKSIVLYLTLHFLALAQTADAYQPIKRCDDHEHASPLPLTTISPGQMADPALHASGNKWQWHGEYSWNMPQEFSTKISGHRTSYSRPHATGTSAEIKYDYHSLFPPHPRQTHPPYPPSSAINFGKPTGVTNSTSKAVVLSTPGTGSSAFYQSTSSEPSRVNASVSQGNLKTTSIEKVTLVPTRLSQTPRFVTKRSTSVSPRLNPKSSISRTTTTKTTTAVTTTAVTTTAVTTTAVITTAVTTTAESSSKPTLPATCPSATFYTVVSGDTCEKIALSQKVPVGKLILQNDLPSACNTLQIGQQLCLPVCNAYSVQPGDTCEKIALSQKVPVRKLILQNDLPSACNTLQIGQQLCLPVCNAYIVQPGDFCFKIAQKFNIELSDLFTANPELNSDCTNLALGGLICIPEPAST